MDMSEQTVVKPYYKEIDILRGLAILMVLCYHSILVYPINLHEIAWCRELHSYLWVVEMPLFFLVSGFCFQYGTPEKAGVGKTYGAYLWKKISGFWCLMWCLAYWTSECGYCPRDW